MPKCETHLYPLVEFRGPKEDYFCPLCDMQETIDDLRDIIIDLEGRVNLLAEKVRRWDSNAASKKVTGE